MTLDVRQNVDLMLQQHRGGDTERLVAGLLDVVQREGVEPLLALERSIDDADGWMLDVIGRRLGFQRPRTTSLPRFWGAAPEDLNFGHGVLASTQTRSTVAGPPVGNEVYRRMLKARGVVLRANGSRADVEAALAALVGGTSFALRERDAPESLGPIPTITGWDEPLTGMCRVGDEIRMMNRAGYFGAFNPYTRAMTPYDNPVAGQSGKRSLSYARGFMWTFLPNRVLRRWRWPASTTASPGDSGYQTIATLRHVAGNTGPLAIGDRLYIFSIEEMEVFDVVVTPPAGNRTDPWLLVRIDGGEIALTPIPNAQAAATNGIAVWLARYGPVAGADPFVYSVDLTTGATTDTGLADALPEDHGIQAMAYHGGSLYAAVYPSNTGAFPDDADVASGVLWRLPLTAETGDAQFQVVLGNLDVGYVDVIRQHADALIPREPGVHVTIHSHRD